MLQNASCPQSEDSIYVHSSGGHQKPAQDSGHGFEDPFPDHVEDGVEEGSECQVRDPSFSVPYSGSNPKKKT